MLDKRNIPRNEKGFALVTALVFLAISGMLGTTALLVTNTDFKIVGNHKARTQAFYIAEAGMARAMAEVKNDLTIDHNLANSTFEAISGPISITPSSSDFYTAFDNIGFGAGAYTIEFKNYGTEPWALWVRSTGNGPRSSSVTVERFLSAENVSPWNNAIFSTGGGGEIPISGNVIIGGSVHMLGEGLSPSTVVFSNQTGDCRNTNADMDSTLALTINGGTTSDLKSTFRIKNGRVDMTLGSGGIGSSSNPFKGIYVTDGADSNGDGVNDDILGGDNEGAGQNIYALKGATKPKPYGLGDSIQMPAIDPAWLNDNSMDLTVSTDTEDPLSSTPKGLIDGDLELTGPFKEGSTWYYPDISKTDGTNSIVFDSSSRVLTINGIIKVKSLTISEDITYSGRGTFYVTGATTIDGNVLTPALSYPTTNVMGVISTGDITLGVNSSQLFLTGVYYSIGTITSSNQTELAGIIVCKAFDITAQVPKIWQVPSIPDNLPPGMPEHEANWVFTEMTWRSVS
jgi:hypothetical protein